MYFIDMHHFHYPPAPRRPAGFAISDGQAGDQVIMLQKLRITSRERKFTDYVRQIHGIFISSACINPAVIHRSLILIHQDDSVDLFLNDFPEEDNVTVNRDMLAGESIFTEDIKDINSVSFPGIEILPQDKIIYQVRTGWEFGLYFDLTGSHQEAYHQEITELKKELMLTNLLKDEEENLKKGEIFVITEGKTDWKHLERAMSALKLSLPIKYFKNETLPSGYSDRAKWCEMLARKENPNKVIFIFDRDQEGLVRKLELKTKNGESYQDWGNNVYSLLIPQPPHRPTHKNVDIELLYEDADLLKKDPNGKRLFFTNEIDEYGVLPGGERGYLVKIADASDEDIKKVFSGKAEDILEKDGTRPGISKSRFAEYVHKKEPGFENINFSNFLPIFHAIGFINAKN